MEFKNLVDIIDFAIEKEKQAAEFYQKVSEQERFSGKKQMLIEFATEELKHKAILEDLKSGNIGDKLDDYEFKWITDIKRSDYVDDVEYKPGMGYDELLLIAMKREEKALQLYNQMLENADTDDAKKVFKMLCQQEAKHKLSLETMYDDFKAQMGD
ncbi:MAG: ferritin family protein [Desulfobacteraceae bacterium]|nr:ferritin family protein [Desulfobacteraceae bacterium]